MKTVGEVSRITGISVRTLHYYDQIGLLKPSRVFQNNYRLYEFSDLIRLQQILFFRELGFPLNEIASIFHNPAFDQFKAMEKHRALLMLKREALDRLICQIDKMLKGEGDMDFDALNEAALEEARRAYAKEAKEQWGGTAAFSESEQKTAQFSKTDWEAAQAEASELLRAFAANRKNGPESFAVQALVASWQAHINRWYYTCTKNILEQLGQMYVEDKRFTKTIDAYGEGTAQLLSRAISHYCNS